MTQLPESHRTTLHRDYIGELLQQESRLRIAVERAARRRVARTLAVILIAEGLALGALLLGFPGWIGVALAVVGAVIVGVIWCRPAVLQARLHTAEKRLTPRDRQLFEPST